MGCGTMRAFAALLQTEMLIFLRDRISLFFTFLFPLIFILIFGFVMGDVDQPTARLGLVSTTAESQEALADVLAQSGVDSVRTFEGELELREAVFMRDIDFGLLWNGTSLEFSYNPNRMQENYAFEQIASGISDAFNLRAQGASPMLPIEHIHVGTEASTRWFNQMVPGIIAFSILSSGLFAVSGHLTAMKERRTLDRMIVTPMPPVALLSAIAAVRLVIVYISTLVTLGISILVFDLSFSIAWIPYTLLVCCSTIGMMGLGTVIALVVRKPSSAGNVANVMAMLMLFLSGVYFPIEFMPRFLRTISWALPLRHMAEAMRFTTGVADMAVTRFWIVVACLLGLGLGLFPVLARYVVRPQRS